MRTLYILLSVVVLLTSCKKSNTEPKSIQHAASGAYTFLFNGNSIDAYGNSTDGNISVCSMLLGNYLSIVGGGTHQSIEFYIKMPTNKISQGNYSTTQDNNYMKYTSTYSTGSYKFYQTTASDIISFSISNLSISSGITYFNASYSGSISDGFGKEFKITNGTLHCAVN